MRRVCRCGYDETRENSADPTVRARARGRDITESLARVLGAWSGTAPELRARIIAGDPVAWQFAISGNSGWRDYGDRVPSVKGDEMTATEDAVVRFAKATIEAGERAKGNGRMAILLRERGEQAKKRLAELTR